jgi:GNAT superfamily N-acetyltransferase
MSVVIRRLPAHGLHRFAEIDRSEEIHIHYRQLGKQLIEEAVSDSVPDFLREGDHHSIPELVKTWQPVVDAGGVLLGAFDNDNLAGLGLLGDDLAPGIVQVALLYVSRSYRRRGVANALMDEMEHLARDRGAHALYVSSVPSESAVGFYLARGFRPTEPLPEQLAKEPEDVHMLLPLAKLSS